MRFAILTLTLLSQLAFAKVPDQFSGTWKEVGFRCEGDKQYTPRESDSDKFFTFNGDTYFHRVELYRKEKCTTLSSAGYANWNGGGTTGNPLTITPAANVSIGCPYSSGGGMVDDFASTIQTLIIKLDNIAGVDYMIVSGDPHYQDPNCKVQLLDRVYQKQ